MDLGNNNHSGLELKVDSEGIIKLKPLKELAEKEGPLKARQDYAQKMPLVLEEALKPYKQGSDEYEMLTRLIKDYNDGAKLDVEGFGFYNPELGNNDNHKFLMNPAINTASNTASLANVPARLVGFLRFAKIPGISKIFLPLAYSLKFMNKAYKEIRKPNPDYKKIAKYGAAGIGGTLIFLPTTFSRGAIYFGVYIPLTVFFNGVLASSSFQGLFGNDAIDYKLPNTKAIRSDLEKQVIKCECLKKKYSGTQFKELKDKKEIVEEVININKYLKHHLKKIRIRDIDIEIDAFKRDLLGSSGADTITGTAEFSAKQLENITPQMFAKLYSSQVFQLDGTSSLGRVNFKADRLLEDMAVYNPDSGYDKAMEEERLTAMAVVYAMQRRNELVEQLLLKYDSEEDLKKEITKNIKDDLTGLKLKQGLIEDIEKMLFPPAKKKVLDKVQSFLGGGGPEFSYAYDYYKLLKKEKII